MSMLTKAPYISPSGDAMGRHHNRAVDVERAIGYGYGVLFSRRHGLSYPLDIVCDAFEGVSRRWDAERTPREPSNFGGLDSDALTMQTLSGDSPAPPAFTHVLPAQD